LIGSSGDALQHFLEVAAEGGQTVVRGLLQTLLAVNHGALPSDAGTVRISHARRRTDAI
jgi:hypothetical protein